MIAKQTGPDRPRHYGDATNDAKVSVLIPVHNGAAFLRETLLSVLNQTRPANEVIVVDDGSSDDSYEVAAEFGRDLRYLRKENGGPASARNFGIIASTSPFLAFIDQDDLWHPAKLERQIACFEQEPELDLCYTLVDLFWDPALAKEKRAYRDHRRSRSVPGYTMPTLLARRSAFERVGPLDEGLMFGDGTDWAMRAIHGALRIKLLPEVLLYHRMHGKNLTRQRESSEREFVHIVWSHLQRKRRSE
jgi:glycosyltransferase involved in cell wall biosynthesis